MNNIDIIYISSLCSKNKFDKLFNNSKIIPGQQVQKYHRLIAEGLALNENIELNILSSLSITRSNCDKLYINETPDIENNLKYSYLPVVNIPGIKNLLIFLTFFFKVLSVGLKNRNRILICDILNISASAGAILAAKLSGLSSVAIVTDIPLFLALNKKTLTVKINNFLMDNFDSYIFLTQQMNTLINNKNKPYVVIEGQVDHNMLNVENNIADKYDKKICIYAGGLQKIYGIEYLVKGFLKANIPDSELHIYGNGHYEKELAVIAESNKTIKYFGVKPNDFVIKEQLKATLLINPRPSDEEFTSYSFPSKNMEYMVSGTPTLTTKLPGMPGEYFEYVYLIENETEDGLAITLSDILSKDKEELHKKGEKAKDFVLKEKNNILQAKKIINMIEGIKR